MNNVYVKAVISLVFCVYRYWLFSDVVPGLYIEKGWVHESINYSFTLPPEQAQAEEVEEDEETEGEGAVS